MEGPFEGTFKDDAGSIVLDMARQQLQNQLAFAHALDAKIGTMFAAGSALLGLLAAVFALQESQTPSLPGGEAASENQNARS